MNREYIEICSRIEKGIIALSNAKIEREHAAEQALNTIVFIPDNDGFDLANTLALREFFRTSEAAAAKLRDQVPGLVNDLDKLSKFFQPVEKLVEKPSFWAKMIPTLKKNDVVVAVSIENAVNCQEAFERGSRWNALILTDISDLVKFVDEMREKVEDALIEPKAFVIDLVRRLVSSDISEQEARKLEAKKLYAEEAIAMAGKHLNELALLKREFSDVVDQLKKNEADNARIEDDVINIHHPDDVEKVTGRPVTSYDL